MPKRPVQFVSRDEVFPIVYAKDGTGRMALNLYYQNHDFMKFLYTFAKYLPGINYISRLIFPVVWVAWEVWQRKARKSSPSSPDEDLSVDPRLSKLIRAVATVVSDGRIPEEVAVRAMALSLALLRAMEDGTIHELSEKAPKVYAIAEVYHKYLRGEVGDEELVAHLGSVQLSMLARAPSVVQEKANAQRPKQPSEDGVFAKLFASLMFSSTSSKHENY